MFIVDDPMLALIARFVMDTEHLDMSDDHFLRAQVQAIEAHVHQFPEDQRQSRALEWIDQHAKQYRIAWQRRAVVDGLTQRRCSDCPLVRDDAGARCKIHAEWVRLLQDYVDDKVSSRQYVEEALRLLKDNKAMLLTPRIAPRV